MDILHTFWHSLTVLRNVSLLGLITRDPVRQPHAAAMPPMAAPAAALAAGGPRLAPTARSRPADSAQAAEEPREAVRAGGAVPSRESRERARAGMATRSAAGGRAEPAGRAPLVVATGISPSGASAHARQEARGALRAARPHVLRTTRSPPDRCAAARRLPAAPERAPICTGSMLDESVHSRTSVGSSEDDARPVGEAPREGQAERVEAKRRACTHEAARSRG